ncbi:MAG: phage holin family protein [Defluviitaleaceae bacterium]|nr:phage holin family protein [Defluviitaleaceae bacterium]
MKKLLIHWTISAIFLYVLSFLFDGIIINNALTAIAAAIVMGLVNATIKPVLQIIALPITFLTLGLFYLVINALMLMLVSALVSGFYVSGFATAFFAAIVLSVLNAVFANKKP